jgi:hypothetical protein
MSDAVRENKRRKTKELFSTKIYHFDILENKTKIKKKITNDENSQSPFLQQFQPRKLDDIACQAVKTYSAEWMTIKPTDAFVSRLFQNMRLK